MIGGNMVDVFLDTSAARSSLQSQKVRKRIQDLVKYGVLKLHIPEIVVRELVTGVSADAFPSASIYKELKRVIPWMGDGEFTTRTKAGARRAGSGHGNRLESINKVRKQGLF